MQDTLTAEPRIWLLLGDKGGDNAQLRILAATLGLPWRELPLAFNGLYRIPNVLHRASLSTLAQSSPRPGPPWPDMVIASGRRTVPIAQWIRNSSGGHTRLVHVGRTWAPFDWFDLIVAMPQYQMPAAENVLQAVLPLNRLPADRLAREAMEWQASVAHLPRPFIAVLIGGPARPLRFGEAEATSMARDCSAIARRAGGSLLAVTSRRTPRAVMDAFTASLDVPHLVHAWQAGAAPNPYAAFLALADRVVVSGDSASMLAEACRTGRPVVVAPLPFDTGPRSQIERGFDRLLSFGPLATLQRHGLAIASRDMPGLIRRLIQAGHVAGIGDPDRATSAPPDDLPTIAARVRALLDARSTTART